MRGNGLLYEKNIHVAPTAGGMPGKTLVHEYQQRLRQAALVKERETR